MGLWETIFKKQAVKMKTKQYFQLINGYTPVYSNYNGGLYEMLQTKAIINTIATDCGKAIPQLAKPNKKIEYMLQHKPNPFMSTSEFIERVVTNYLCDNNSFIVPIIDEYDSTVGLFPIKYNQAELVTYRGVIFVKWDFGAGYNGCIELERCGFIKRMQYKNDFFGDNNSALNQTLEVIHSQNESMTNALKDSGVFRFMGQLSEQLIDKEDFENERKTFSEVNLTSNNSQMMIYDSRYKEIKQVESKPIYLDTEQQALIDENTRDYFGVSKNVIQHAFKDDYEWNSYYEGIIEPILIKIAAALTGMTYTPSQIMAGNQVYMTTNRLQYMSNESKLAFSSQMFDRGILCGNDVADVWQLPHYEGGDKHFIRKEYAEINKLGENDPPGEIQQKPLDAGGEGDEGKQDE